MYGYRGIYVYIYIYFQKQSYISRNGRTFPETVLDSQKRSCISRNCIFRPIGPWAHWAMGPLGQWPMGLWGHAHGYCGAMGHGSSVPEVLPTAQQPRIGNRGPQGARDQGARDQGTRDQGTGAKGARPSDQGPRDWDQGTRDQGRQGPRALSMTIWKKQLQKSKILATSPSRALL